MKDKNIEEISDLSSEDENKIIRIQDSFTRRFEAEERKEAQLKMRILFERTASEMLPFIIYCVYIGASALVGFPFISQYEGWKFYSYVISLVIICILPILILPRLPFIKWFQKKR